MEPYLGVLGHTGSFKDPLCRREKTLPTVMSLKIVSVNPLYCEIVMETPWVKTYYVNKMIKSNNKTKIW